MADVSVADLTVGELRTLIREVVTETITSLFIDPDEGLELREEFAADLRRSLQQPAGEQETESLEDILRELGLG
jgi:hypothetical protein